MKMTTPEIDCVVYGPLATFLRMSRILGIAPLRFRRSGDGWKVTHSSRLSGLRYIGLVFVSFIIIDNWVKLSYKHNIASIASHIVSSSSTALTSSTFIYCAPRHMQAMMICINRVDQIYRKLKVNPLPVRWSKNMFALFLLILLILLSLYCIIDYLSFLIFVFQIGDTSLWKKTSFILLPMCSILNFLGTVIFLLLALRLETCFRAVNNGLTQIEPRCSQDFPGSIHQLCSAYSSSCDILRLLNKVYGPVLVSVLFTTLTSLVRTPYFLIQVLREDTSIFGSLKEIAWIIFSVISFLVIVEPCEWTLTEISTTSSVVGRHLLATHISQRALMFELQQFYRQMALNDISYRPLNLFTLSRTLIFTFLRFMITHLCVLLDMK